jgi:type II secretory ATPase GspE/PulE/Tfp pilus assembly ATPase PilB-like protein
MTTNTDIVATPNHVLASPPARLADNPLNSSATLSAHELALCSSDEARALLSAADALNLKVLPLSLTNTLQRPLLLVAASKDENRLVHTLRFLCGVDIRVKIVALDALEQAIPKAYYGSEVRLKGYLDKIAPGSISETTNDNKVPFELALQVPTATGDAAKFLTAILEFAAVRGASDLHLSPGEDTVVVKLRIDGELCCLETQPYAKSFHEQITSRLKLLAGLDMTNKRLPQDGSFTFNIGNKPCNARVSTLPTVHGESAVIRLLHTTTIPELTALGLTPSTYLLLRQALNRTEGLILLSGPTGSGKTTTLYSLLNELARRGKSIVTVEDPVETPLRDIVQVQLSSDQGLDFPRAIRSVLRHDPDVLMLGEMRDPISASMALDAASTGHLTLSSLHVGSSLQAVNRLEVLGVPRSRVVPPLAVVINQRLIQKLCRSCKELDTRSDRTSALRFYRARGCRACGGSGYRGRVLVTESLDLQSAAAKEPFYRAGSILELLEMLPTGALSSWTTCLQDLLNRGEISLEQIERFVSEELG